MEIKSATRLVLVRHGESRATVDRVVGGRRGDQGLSEAGVRQCVALRDRFSRTGELDPVAFLYSSELRRAVETAGIIAPAFGLVGRDVVRQAALCGLDPGVGDGLRWEEFERPASWIARTRRADPDALAPGGRAWPIFQLEGLERP